MEVNTAALVDDLAKMIAIPSCNTFGAPYGPGEGEEGMATYLEARMIELGLEVDSHEVLPGRRNVWGRLRGAGKGPTFALAGHMDTVGVTGYDQPFEPRVKDGKIYGRGSCDMKAGLAAYLEVVRLIQTSNKPLQGDLMLIFVVDEEHAMDGSRFYGQNGPAADLTLIAEPSQLAISPAHRGQVCFGLKTFGRSTHSSMPQNGINAIYHMAKIVTAVEAYAQDLGKRSPHPLCGVPTCSLGTIQGGLNASSVPDVCEIEIDRRTIPGEDHTTIAAEFQALFDTLELENPEMRLENVRPSLNVSPLNTPADHPLVTALSAAHQQVLGRNAEIKPFPGSTDAPNFRGVKVICGPGELAQCHSLNEYVTIDEIVAAVKIYETTIRALQP